MRDDAPSRMRVQRLRAAKLALLLSLLLLLALAGCASAPPLPPRAVALNAAGADALARGDLATAEARLSVALEYSPRFVEAWVNLGYVELRRGNFEQARRDFEQARALNPDVPAPHHALGLLAEHEGDGAQAERDYRAALKVDPGFAPSRANLARRLFARAQWENAREQYERLVAVAPDAIEGWCGEVEALLRLERGAQADEVLARATERFGDVPALRLLLARALMRRAEWSDAEATLAAIAGGPDRSRAAAAWAWIAMARIGGGDGQGAIEAARASLALDRDQEVARYALELALNEGTGTPSQRAPR
jgi:Tfp pilus assembly protein PilF